MNNIKVSIIIPVYNTEAYVEAAVRSIMDQTLRDIELIVVNDGSTDGSPAVLKRLAAEDGRITIHSQPNKGLSEARNAGIDRARGQFIYFMDSDDLLESDALASCYARCVNSDLDFVFFDAESFGAITAQQTWYDYHRAKYFKEDHYRGTDLLREMLDRNCYRASACLSFIRRSFLAGLELRFYPGILHEDELFTPQLYIAAQRAGGIERAFFRRRVREGSIMGNRFSQRNLKGYMTVTAELQIYAAKRNEDIRTLVHRLMSKLLTAICHNAWQLPAGNRWRLAATLLRHYPYCMSFKQTTIMLLKSPIHKLRRR